MEDIQYDSYSENSLGQLGGCLLACVGIACLSFTAVVLVVCMVWMIVGSLWGI